MPIETVHSLTQLVFGTQFDRGIERFAYYSSMPWKIHTDFPFLKDYPPHQLLIGLGEGILTRRQDLQRIGESGLADSILAARRDWLERQGR